MELSVVLGEPTKRMLRPLVPAVVLDRFVGNECEEEDDFTFVHAREVGGKDATEGVGGATLNWVVVVAAVGVGYIKTVVHSVDVLVQEGDSVEQAVDPVLVRVEDEANIRTLSASKTWKNRRE